MATINDLITEAAGWLEDPAFERTTSADHLRNCNRALEELCRAKPDAYTKRDAITLVAGIVQTLPARRHLLLRPLWNLGNDSVPAQRIRFVTVDDMGDADQDWPSATEGTVVEEIVYDPRNPLEFMVHPPVPAGYQVAVVNAAIPDEVSTGTTFPLPDIYRLPIVYWMAGLALMENRADMNFDKGAKYIGMAMSALSVQTTTQGR